MTMTAETTSKSDPYARNGNGRFAKGNRGGPGNPHAREMAKNRKAILEFYNEERLQEFLFKMHMWAMMGNAAAIKMISSYLFGKPSDCVDPDKLDQQEWEKMQEEMAMFDQCAGDDAGAAHGERCGDRRDAGGAGEDFCQPVEEEGEGAECGTDSTLREQRGNEEADLPRLRFEVPGRDEEA